MACSHCGASEHRIQTCPTVRRCGHCQRPGHDRRNCPRLADTSSTPAGPPREAPPPRHLSADDPLWKHIARLAERCSGEPAALAHLYWPEREHYFEESRRRYEQGGPWRLKATSGHGVGAPARPTVNLFATNSAWLQAYTVAAANRGLRHGLFICRKRLEALACRPGFELREVRIGHPNRYGVHNSDDFWQFDIGNHRYKALHDLRFSTVVRLATPHTNDAQFIDIPHEAVLACW